MRKKPRLFDDDWVAKASANASPISWAQDVLGHLDTTGGVYLCTLRSWFDNFPLSAKKKNQLETRLEDTKNEDHLGAVNELAWWQFLCKQGFNMSPIPATKTATPDFKITSPLECFMEVSTLNVSDADKAKFESEESIELDYDETLRRILGKLTDEKFRQLSYAADQTLPCVLVIFDYTIWSGFGTRLCWFLAEFLLGQRRGFLNLPGELSALVYVDRIVMDGHIGFSLLRTAAYYNPNAKYDLPVGTFATLRQFSVQMVSSEPRPGQGWIWL